MGAAHVAEPGGVNPFAIQRVRLEIDLPAGPEGFVGALQDALRADVDPAARRHLAVHHESHAVEMVEVFLRGVAGHEVGVGDDDARRVGMRGRDVDRLAGLHAQGFIAFQALKFVDDAVVLLPVARRPPGTAVDDELAPVERDAVVEIVLEHAQGRFRIPVGAFELERGGGARRFFRTQVQGHRPRGGLAPMCFPAHEAFLFRDATPRQK